MIQKSLRRSEPMLPLARLRYAMDRLLDGFFENGDWPFEPARRPWMPPMDVRETDDSVVVEAELPGVEMKDVTVEVSGDTLTIRAERRQEAVEKTATLHRQECAYGAFERRIALPSAPDPGRVEATFANGVLKIALPKAPASKPRSVNVKVKQA